jgi:spermidine/putrescine transport system substrate-binding protein
MMSLSRRITLPNAKSLDPRYLKRPFDAENKFSLPYDWGTTGIAVNRDLYKGEIKGWKDLFNKADLAGKFSLLDDPREVIGAALKAQCLSLNTKSADDLKKAKELLLKVRPHVKAFTSEALMPLVNGETAVAHAYSSDALQARKKTGGKIEYILPEEGGTLWIDNLVIPKGAQNVEGAHALINFLLEPETNAKTVNAIFVATANKATLPLLPQDLQTNRMLFPTDAQLAKSEMIQDLGEALEQWDRLWTEVKTQQ